MKKRKASDCIENIESKFLQKQLTQITTDDVLDLHVRLKKIRMVKELKHHSDIDRRKKKCDAPVDRETRSYTRGDL